MDVYRSIHKLLNLFVFLEKFLSNYFILLFFIVDLIDFINFYSKSQLIILRFFGNNIYSIEVINK